MTINSSRVASLIDAADTLVLRAADAGADTATATEPGVLLNIRPTPYWNEATDVHGDAFEVTFHVTAVDADGGTVVLAVVIDDTADMSDSAAVVANLPITDAGIYRVGFDRATLAALDADISSGRKYIAARVTLSGGGGSETVTYSATLTRKL